MFGLRRIGCRGAGHVAFLGKTVQKIGAAPWESSGVASMLTMGRLQA
ncbi:hypothetical protein ART_2755 [Arthrobacter sp. PAMC 25486]|nr:hypothetical protein ART_2755 [Arthrobacter sp. PAMC 25486]